MPNRELTAHDATELLLVLGVAAFMLGVAMVSQGVLMSHMAAPVVPTTRIALGRVESLVPAQAEDPVATMPPADRVPPTPMMSTASRGRTRVVAACTQRLARECDLRLVLMDLALQQRGFSLGRPVAPSEQAVPAKYRALARAEASVAPAAASPPAVPRAKEAGC
jgi:hypothetical protein